jgi:type I restriction enzyme S subunit
LRFPEFQGEWEDTILNTICDFVGGGTPSSSNLEFWDGDIPWISSSDLEENNISKIDMTRYITQDAVNSSATKICQAPAILLVSRVGVGKVACLNKGKICTSQDFTNLVNIKCNEIFLSYLLSKKMKDKAKETQGTSIKGITSGEIRSIKIHIPQSEEQAKISSLLRLLDERISTQNKIIEELESLIRGIYSVTKRDGWIMYYLKDILEERNEQNIHEYPVFSVAVREGIINQIEHLGRSFAAKNTLNYNVVQFGDIVYTKSPTGDFPYGIVKQSSINHPVAVSPLYGVYKPKNLHWGNIVNHYFLSPINANNYLHSLIQKGAKNTINITSQRFLDKAILLPTNEIEIKNISLLLKVISKKIHLEKNALKKLETQKAFLLQRMFI